MRSAKGFTLVEVLIALLILTLVVTTSLAFFYDRRLRLLRAEETIVAYQTLANEAEVQRRAPIASLAAGTHPFIADHPLLTRLPDQRTSIEVMDQGAGIRKVLLTIQWRQQKRIAQMTIIRVVTNGDNLW